MVEIMIKLCHSSKFYASLCSYSIKQQSAGSWERMGFDQLTALCLWCSAADLSSCPESRIHLGFSKKMINNNNPLREWDRGRDERDHCGEKTELLPHVFFSADLCSLVLAIIHLKFSAVHRNVREQQTWSWPIRGGGGGGIAGWCLSPIGEECNV